VLIALAVVSLLGADAEGPSRHPHDPVIARVDLVNDDGPGMCPSVALSHNGDLIATWTDHGDIEAGGTAYFARSTDGGATWAPPYLTVKNDKASVGTSPALYRLPKVDGSPGRLLCTHFEADWVIPGNAASRKFDVYYTISEDDGRTFGERRRLNDPEGRNDFPQGHMVQAQSGDLLWVWGRWNPDPVNGFKRSTDGGLTWGATEKAWQDPPPGQEKKLVFNETGVAVCPDGTIIAVARTDVLVDKKFWQVESRDNGHTWSPPHQLELAGGSPAMYCTPSGQVWLAYRDAGLGPGVALAVSDNSGDTWRFLYHLKEPKEEHDKLYGHIRYTDEDRLKPWRPAEGVAGYPWFQRLSDTEVYVVFHVHNRAELPQKFPEGADPFYIAGNVLRHGESP
jgi:BNR repeat-like domain